MNITISKKNNLISGFSIGMLFLGFYVLTNYIAKEGMLPPFTNSIALYAFIGVSFVSLCFNLKTMKLPNFTIWYASIVVLSAISFMYSGHIVYSALIEMVVCLILSFCFIMTINNFVKVDVLARVYIWSSVLMSFILLVTDQLILNVEEGERLGEELSGNANAFSNMILVATIFTSWFMVYCCKNKTRLLYILAFLSQLFVMALSGGRKNMIASIICALVFIFFYSGKKKTSIIKRLLLCAVLVLSVYWAIMNIPILYDAIGHRFESLLNDFFGIETTANKVGSDAIREKMVEIGLEGWLEAPIFGHGLDNFKYYCQDVLNRFCYAHNNYVELLYDIGLIGFVAYYIFITYMFIKLIKLPEALLKYKILGIGLLVGIAVFDFGGVSFYTALSICALAIVYAIINISYKHLNQEEQVVNDRI